MKKSDWLKERTKGITGTDISAIVGLNRWKTPREVWCEKLELVEPIEESEAMLWGRLQEPIIADYYAQKHHVRLYDPGLELFYDKDTPYYIGTPDRLVLDGKGGYERGLEIKTANSYKASEWGEPGTDDIPQEYFLQSQWYMGILGLDLWDVAVKIDSAQYKEYELRRDENLINRLRNAADRFWEENVLRRIEPTPPEGGAYENKYLKNMADTGVMKVFDEAGVAAAIEYAKAKAALKEAEAEEERLANALKNIIGDASGIEGSGYKITWKQSKGRTVIDYDAVLHDLSSVVAQDILMPTIKRHTYVKPGSRRFIFKESE